MRGAWRCYYSRAYTGDISYWKCTNVCRLFAYLNVDCLSWQLFPQTQDIFVAFGLRSSCCDPRVNNATSSRSSPVAMRVHPSSSPSLSSIVSSYIHIPSIQEYITHMETLLFFFEFPLSSGWGRSSRRTRRSLQDRTDDAGSIKCRFNPFKPEGESLFSFFFPRAVPK